MEPGMDDRSVSILIKSWAAIALVAAASLAGWDAVRSLSSMHTAEFASRAIQRNLTDLALTLLGADGEQHAGGDGLPRIHQTMASLERNIEQAPALRSQVQDLENRVQAYRNAGNASGARAAQATQIGALASALQAEGERQQEVRRAALNTRLYADLVAVTLLSGLLGAIFMAGWRRSPPATTDNDKLMRQVLEGMPFALCVVGREGQPMLVNAAARGLWEDDRGHPRQLQRDDLEQRPEHHALYQALSSGYGADWEIVDAATQGKASRRLLVSAAPLRDAEGAPAGAFAVYIDRTMVSQSDADASAGGRDTEDNQERKLPSPFIPEAGTGNEDKFATGHTSHVFLIDGNGLILAVNQPLIEFSGMDCTGGNYLEVCEASAAEGVPEAARIAAGIRAVASGDVPTFCTEYLCRNGEHYFWCRATASRIAGDDATRIVVVHENITQHKTAETALRESALSMRELAEHQESVREEERKRIAREIHDELGQQLLALKIDVSILQGQLSHVPEATAQLDGMLRTMSSLMQSMRSIINDLRPAVLDLGLHAAVEWQTREFQRKTGISCALLSDGEEIVLSDACATALFRTLQESLTNVSRHAHASHVDVQLYATQDTLLMRVSDDGIGRLGKEDKPDAFGLRGMHERISSLGGKLIVTAVPDQGVTVTATVPISTAVQAAHRGFERRSTIDRRARVRTG
jgi:signal transduction histidine kinase